MFLCFGAVAKPYEQNFPLVPVLAVYCGVILLLYLIQGIYPGFAPEIPDELFRAPRGRVCSDSSQYSANCPGAESDCFQDSRALAVLPNRNRTETDGAIWTDSNAGCL